MKTLYKCAWLVLLWAGACSDVTPGATTSVPAEAIDAGPAEPEQRCIPGTGVCNGSTSTVCTDDGLGFVDVYCDPVQALSCDTTSGLCAGECAPQSLGKSYIGCEYYPTVTNNALLPAGFNFAVAVSNTSAEVAKVYVDGGALGQGEAIKFEVAPGTVEVRTLPWHDGLKNVGSTRADGGAYHLRSDRPVTVYQFNALEYQLADTSEFSYTNDASLLLPVNAMTGSYRAASYGHWEGYQYPGFISVVSTQNHTEVTITSTAVTEPGGIPAMSPGTSSTVTLDRGDVLQVATASGDLTGTSIEASAPVQVIGGHDCTNVPVDAYACDHLEESIFPVETLGNRYVVTAPAVPSLPDGKIRVVRIIATAANTSISFNPAQAGAGTHLANAGDFVEIENTAASFEIIADQKVVVSEYMEGQSTGGDTGDPAMTLATPVGQYRDAYQFHAPQNYESNYVNVVAPKGVVVTLDGEELSGFESIAGTDYQLVRVQLPAKDSGNYTLSGDGKFGITVYGYGQYTSYWYPGGLDLEVIGIE